MSVPVAVVGAPAPAVPARTRLMLEGPILVTLLRLALPNVVVVVVQACSSAVDAFYLGRLGPEVLAGVALVFPVWMLMVTMSSGGVGGGISSSVARALGGGRHAEADDLVLHSLVLAVALAAIFTAATLLGGPLLYRTMGGGGLVLGTALTYSSIVFGGALLVWLVNAQANVLRGSGEMAVPATVIVAGELCHIALAPLLIFGLGWGVAGAATSLLVSYALRMTALAVYLLGGRAAVRIPAGRPRLRVAAFREILRVALPGSLNTLLTNGNVVAVTSLVSPAGVYALAGYGLASRLEYLQIPIVFGFGTALVTMVGTNVGAGQRERARRIIWTGGLVAAATTGVIGLIAAALPGAWLDLFTADERVVAAGASYLQIVGPAFGFFGLGLALYFAAQGAGRLRFAIAAAIGRVLVAAGGGWLLVGALGLDLGWLFAAIALAHVGYGLSQALTVGRVAGVDTAGEGA